MATLDASKAIARMKGFGTFRPGRCLEAVWRAFGAVASIGPHAGQYPYALKGWQYSEKKHAGDRTVPAGAPVYFTAGSNGFGHVAISLGGNRVLSTDIPSAGLIGVTTIEAIEKRWGRKYLGWTGDFLGHSLSKLGLSTTKPAASGATLKLGSHGPEVKRLQDTLNRRYPLYSRLREDGVFGPRTAATVKEFQRRSGLHVDGIFGPKTRAKLYG